MGRLHVSEDELIQTAYWVSDCDMNCQKHQSQNPKNID